jgi:surfactin family lipopeptide synthetase C
MKSVVTMQQNIEDIYVLTPLQEGLLYHTLARSGLYTEQMRCILQGALNVDALQRACQKVIERHAILRTAFWWEEIEQPVQIVYRKVEVPWQVLDWRTLPPEEQEQQLQELERDDQQRGFDLTRAPLLRFTLVRLSEERYAFLWSHHHLLLDGWSMPIVLKEMMQYYDQHVINMCTIGHSPWNLLVSIEITLPG